MDKTPIESYLSAGSPGSWDGDGVGWMKIAVKNGTYHAFFIGFKGENGRIGLATSGDGVAWQRFSGNPVLRLEDFGDPSILQLFPSAVLFKEGLFYCLIYGRNYGEAGAIDYFGREAGFPPAISQHNSYWYWSLEHLKQDAAIIVIGVNKDQVAGAFEEVQEAGIVRSDFAMPHENNLPILICRRLRMPILELWNKRRVFI